jgi:carbamoyltransferase
VQPAAGDAGGALGAALAGHYIFLGNATRSVAQDGQDAMHGSYLGSEYSELDVLRMARSFGAVFKQYDNVDKTAAEAALRISRGEVVGWFQGRMEWGPRSLGNRSIQYWESSTKNLVKQCTFSRTLGTKDCYISISRREYFKLGTVCK